MSDKKTAIITGASGGIGGGLDAVLYLAQADQVTGEVLHVDGGSHAGRW